jgi:tetratricopeptide (TPR) repeat protein
MLALAAACSTAPRISEGVTTAKNQAAQDSTTGEAYFRQGRYDLALQFFTRSLNGYTSVDDEAGIVQSYTAIGATYMAMGSLDMAEEILLRARERSRGMDPTLLAVSTNILGELYLAKGEAQKALDTLEQALAMPAASRTPMQTGLLYHNLGIAQKDLGNLAQAQEYYRKSLAINLANKLIEQAAGDYYMIAAVQSKSGEYDEAQKSASLALAADKRIENTPGIAQDLYALGLIATRRTDAAAAYDYFQRSYLVYTLGWKPEMKKALTELIAAADALGRTAEAEAFRKTLSDLGSS